MTEQNTPVLTERLFRLIRAMSEEKQAELLRFLSENMRRFPRKQCVIAVDCRIRGTVFRDYILDISQGGVFLETTRSLRPGEEVLLVFTLPNSSTPLSLSGKVAWKNVQGAGIEFDGLAHEQKDLLRSFLNSTPG